MKVHTLSCMSIRSFLFSTSAFLYTTNRMNMSYGDIMDTMGGTSYKTRNFVQTHFTHIFYSKTTKKKHQNDHQNMFEWTVTPNVAKSCLTRQTIWYDITRCTCSVHMHMGIFVWFFHRKGDQCAPINAYYSFCRNDEFSEFAIRFVWSVRKYQLLSNFFSCQNSRAGFGGFVHRLSQS